MNQLEKEIKKEWFRVLYQTRMYSNNALARKLKVSRRTAGRWRKLFFPEDDNWRWEEFIKLYQMGIMDEDEIASALRVTRTSVVRYIRRYKISQGIQVVSYNKGKLEETT